MSKLRKWACAAVLAAATASPAVAQQGTITSGGGRTTTSLSGTGGTFGGGGGQLGGTSLGGGGLGGSGGGLGGGSGGLGGGGGLGGSSGGGLGGSDLQSSPLQTMQASPKLSPPTGQSSSTLAKSNFLAGYYANPYFQGQISQQTNAQPGGFGSPLYGTSTGGGGIQSQRLGGGLGGGTLGGGLGGRGGLSNQQSGILIPIQTQIAYTAKMQFPTPPAAAGRIQAELRGLLDNTNQIANPRGVQIIVDAQNNVILRGSVKDEDEARLVEGLVRLTPGVQGIANELTATAGSGPGR